MRFARWIWFAFAESCAGALSFVGGLLWQTRGLRHLDRLVPEGREPTAAMDEPDVRLLFAAAAGTVLGAGYAVTRPIWPRRPVLGGVLYVPVCWNGFWLAVIVGLARHRQRPVTAHRRNASYWPRERALVV